MVVAHRRETTDSGEAVGAPEPSAADPAASRGEILRRDGDYWAVTYEGGTFRLRDTKGLQYLVRRLSGRKERAAKSWAAARGAGHFLTHGLADFWKA